jgi:hypothetical protein
MISRKQSLTELETAASSDLLPDGKMCCVKPSSVVTKDTTQVASMFGSHDWKVLDSKPFAASSVLIQVKCARCSADGVAIINDGAQ